MAGCTGCTGRSGPFPCPGFAGWMSFPLRVNEPAGRTDGRATSAALLWSRPTRQIVPPVTRHTRCRAA
jgi:hypothetical protein